MIIDQRYDILEGRKGFYNERCSRLVAYFMQKKNRYDTEEKTESNFVSLSIIPKKQIKIVARVSSLLFYFAIIILFFISVVVF